METHLQNYILSESFENDAKPSKHADKYNFLLRPKRYANVVENIVLNLIQ